MNAVRAVLSDFGIFFNPKTRAGLIRLAVLALVVAAGAIFAFHSNEPEPTTEPSTRSVTVARVATLEAGSSLSLVGTVEAVDQATIQAEVGGRVTSVRAELGDRVGAGAILATIENASEAAALTSAEGSYEAALAASAQSDVSADQARTSLATAENNAVNDVRDAYNAVSGAIHNYIDTFFATPDAQFTPGLRLEGYGYTSYLNNERVAFQTILRTWQGQVNTLDTEDDLNAALNDAEGFVKRTIQMVDTFIIILNNQDAGGAYSADQLASYSASFTTLRGTLNTTLLSLQNAETSLQSATESVKRADIAGTGGTVSSADAAVKQALGALRSAQATYNKTILRTPVAGTVQSLNVKTGDYINPNTTAATVANEDALLITTYVTRDERDRLAVGDAVTLEGGAEGTITAIAPSVDPVTGKIEVKIESASDALDNGDVVSLSMGTTTPDHISGDIRVPLSAFKITVDGPVAFTVENGVLVAHPVTLGAIEGDRVIVTTGLTRDMEIVTDARGLREGEPVTVTTR
jgi:RND family efflux transporter MFP subunit